MSIVICSACDKRIDLDFVSDIIWIRYRPYHFDCADELGLLNEDGEPIDDDERG